MCTDSVRAWSVALPPVLCAVLASIVFLGRDQRGVTDSQVWVP